MQAQAPLISQNRGLNGILGKSRENGNECEPKECLYYFCRMSQGLIIISSYLERLNSADGGTLGLAFFFLLIIF